MDETKVVKGYKVFNPDWTCRGKQYTCPGRFEEDVTPSVCDAGMHFCKKVVDCFNYYKFNPENKVAEVVAYGEVAESRDKCCTDKLEILHEISWAEVLEIVNIGKGCSGICNSGSYNSGNYNSGGCNSGNCNSGAYNSGDYNKCSFSNGCFNTVCPKIYLFNKPSELTYKDWLNSEAKDLIDKISGCDFKYIHISNMTSEEKEAHPCAIITGGYLKRIDSSETVIDRWRSLSASEKKTITSIPNFDKEIFKEITGIDVDAE